MAKRIREPAAFSYRVIAYLGGGLLLLLVIISTIIFAIVGHPSSAQRNAFFIGDGGVPQPRLQAKPSTDFADFQSQKNTLLTEYGWVDRKNAVVKIPIDRAMEIIASHGSDPTEPSK